MRHLLASAALALGVAVCAAPAESADRTGFSIPRQDVRTALTLFAQQSGLSIFFPSRQLGQAMANEVEGPFTVEDGLRRLLAGTGVTASLDVSGQIMVRILEDRPAGSAASARQSPAAEPVVVAPKAPDSAGLVTNDAKGLQEVVVTARRREENLQDIPIAMSVVSGEFIGQGGFPDTESVMVFIPNVTVRNDFQGQTITVRGIGTDTRNEAFEQAVAQFSDGVYYGRDNLVLTSLFDLERMEVVRGPQPVFAGQSATAGAINTISRKPGETFEGNVTLAYGDDEERSYDFAIGGPVSDSFGVRLAGRYYELPDAGYTELLTGSKIGAQQTKAARLTASWSPADTLGFTFKYEYQDVYQNGTPSEYGRCDLDLATSVAGGLGPGLPALCTLQALYGLSDLSRYNRTSDSGGTVDVWDAIDDVNANLGGAIVTPVARGLNHVGEYTHPQDRNMDADILLGAFNWSLGRHTFSGTSAYVSFDKEDWLDPDESVFAVFTDQRREQFEQLSQELRVASPLDQTVSWMIGAYWQKHASEMRINVHHPVLLGAPVAGMIASSPSARLSEHSRWAALFFTGAWSITDTFRFNFGGRYQWSRKDGRHTLWMAYLPAGGTAFGSHIQLPGELVAEVDSEDFLPELGLQWNPAGNYMVYAKYSEAFKAGGFVMNPPLGGAAPRPFTYKPEEASGYEVGLKGTFFDNTLQFNLAFFDTDFTDLQVNSFNSTTARFEVRNSAEASTRGVEIDGRWAIGDYWTLGFNGGYVDARFTSFPNGQCGAIQARDWAAAGNPGTCVIDISGRSLEGPDWQIGLMPAVSFSVGTFEIKADLNVTWIAGTKPPANPDDRLNWIEQRERYDLRVALQPPNGSWELALYGRDLASEQPHVGGIQSGALSNTNCRDNSDLCLYGVGGQRFERGRRIGLQATYFLGRQ